MNAREKFNKAQMFSNENAQNVIYQVNIGYTVVGHPDSTYESSIAVEHKDLPFFMKEFAIISNGLMREGINAIALSLEIMVIGVRDETAGVVLLEDDLFVDGASFFRMDGNTPMFADYLPDNDLRDMSSHNNKMSADEFFDTIKEWIRYIDQEG